MTDAEREFSSVVADPDQQPALVLVGDLEDADYVRNAVWTASDGFTKSVRVDLSAVTFLPSTVIGALVGSMNIAKDAGVTVKLVIAAGSPVERNLQVTLVPHTSL